MEEKSHSITLFGDGEDIIFIPTSREEESEIAGLVKKPCRIAVIDNVDWNLELTPWQARAAFGKEDFGGGAESFLSELVNIAGRLDGRKFIAGYSLAGLFALWSVTKTDVFIGAASVSGSLWFDGFTEYFINSTLNTERIYLSLGDRESRTKDKRLATVGECTDRIFENIRDRGVKTIYEQNPGGHFNEPAKRMAKSIEWLIGGKKNV